MLMEASLDSSYSVSNCVMCYCLRSEMSFLLLCLGLFYSGCLVFSFQQYHDSMSATQYVYCCKNCQLLLCLCCTFSLLAWSLPESVFCFSTEENVSPKESLLGSEEQPYILRSNPHVWEAGRQVRYNVIISNSFFPFNMIGPAQMWLQLLATRSLGYQLNLSVRSIIIHITVKLIFEEK